MKDIIETFPKNTALIKALIREDLAILKKENEERDNIKRRLVNKVFMDDIEITVDLIMLVKGNSFIQHTNGKGQVTGGENRTDRIERLQKLLNLYKRVNPSTKKNYPNYEDSINKAKEYPIENLVAVNKAGFAKCPIHNEKTSSFKVYKGNRWYCFGACGRGGDVIDLFMLINNCTLQEAVKKLCQ